MATCKQLLQVLLIGWIMAALGCSSAQRDAAVDASSVAGQAIIADQMLQSGIVEQTVLSDSVTMTPEQVQTLEDAFAQYQRSREQISAIIDNPAAAIDSPAIIRAEHARLDEAYRSVQEVVADNWSEYSAVDQSRLDRWRGQVARLEMSYQRLAQSLSEVRNVDARRARIIELARIVGRIALMAV